MMIAEIVGGIWFGSVALIADGLHMSTHTGALLIAALAYSYSAAMRTTIGSPSGTGKLGDLAAFSSAIVLAMVALLIVYEFDRTVLSPGRHCLRRRPFDCIPGSRRQPGERLPAA